MEQDAHDYEGGLPTYNELEAQSSPNSRFGRWKSWIEKRAAERYAEETPEARQARRARGWGTHLDTQSLAPPLQQSQPTPTPTPTSSSSSSNPGLTRTQTALSNPPNPDEHPRSAASCQVTFGQALPPSHLRLHSFGSRFLPHSEVPILSCLPLFEDQKLLLGHTDGLTLLDMAPNSETSDSDICEPRRRDVWRGEGVYQMEILEQEQPSTSDMPVGVVLVLVGAEPPDATSETEPTKMLRMYNLASLASLVLWTTTRKGDKPLDLGRLGDWQRRRQKHKHHLSRGVMPLGQLGLDPVSELAPPPPPKDWPRTSLTSRASPVPQDSTDSWVVVDDDDIPLRWATDYVPLASRSSRLGHHSVLSFELHKCTDGGHVTARLAVVTKQNVLLYEAVRGERAFRFVKEFYTPIPARSVTFVSQEEKLTKTIPFSIRGSPKGSLSEPSSRRISTPLPLRATAQVPKPSHLSLFVIFEKKAGLIKISDSSVGELELWEAVGQGHSRSMSGLSTLSTGSRIRSLQSPDSPLSGKDVKGQWVPPAEVQLPLARTNPHSFAYGTPTMLGWLLTRGKVTHLVRAPLALPLAAHAPLAVLTWGVRPSRVVPRVCEHPASGAPFLQVTGLGSDGVEVQELDLGFLLPSRGKGREMPRVVVQAEVGPGGAGFLCRGGHWTEVLRPRLQRQESTSTVDTLQLNARREREAGFYAWTQYAINDWRVFWLGGDTDDGEAPPLSP